MPASSRPTRCLLVYPRFSAASFWNFSDIMPLFGRKYITQPLGLLTVAALLPDSWEFRLADLNTRDLADADLDWADLVMTGGMITQPAGFVTAVRHLCDKYGIFMVADEVMTGFGRTGRMFACQADGVTPDFLCLSKGLT